VIRRVESVALQGLLTAVALAMAVASRGCGRFRRQVTRDLVVEVASGDRVRQQYHFVAATRRMHAPLHPRGRHEVRLRFGSARDGLRTLLSTRTAGRIVEGMNTGDTRIEGNPALVLWFHGMTRVVVPIGSTRRPRRPAPVPVRGPEPEAPHAARILTEPAARELSRDWPQAWRARARLLHVRAPEGARLPRG
jgi:hypothetical protein